MGKRREDKEIWQREKEEMLRQVNRLRAEVLAAENDKASLEEMNYRSEEYKGVWQSEREEMEQQVNRLREGVLTAKNAKAAAELQAQKVWITVHVSALKLNKNYARYTLILGRTTTSAAGRGEKQGQSSQGSTGEDEGQARGHRENP